MLLLVFRGLPTLYASKLVMEMARPCKAWKTMKPFPTLRTVAWKTLIRLASPTFPQPRRRDELENRLKSLFAKALACSRQPKMPDRRFDVVLFIRAGVVSYGEITSLS